MGKQDEDKDDREANDDPDQHLHHQRPHGEILTFAAKEKRRSSRSSGRDRSCQRPSRTSGVRLGTADAGTASGSVCIAGQFDFGAGGQGRRWTPWSRWHSARFGGTLPLVPARNTHRMLRTVGEACSNESHDWPNLKRAHRLRPLGDTPVCSRRESILNKIFIHARRATISRVVRTRRNSPT
jgi:hypothetical protein